MLKIARVAMAAALASGMGVLLVGGAGPAFANQIQFPTQAMEGNLKVNPGNTLMAGYDITIPGNHPASTVSIVNAQVTFQAGCASGPGGGVVTVPLGAGPNTIPANDSGWYPSGDQHSSLVYQGSISVPNLCGGGQVSFQQGGTFSGDLQSTDTSTSVHVRWHYSANGTSGSWSGTGSFVPDPTTAVPVGAVGGGVLALLLGGMLFVWQRRSYTAAAGARS